MVDRKWQDNRLRIVFCGRNFAEKNGMAALRVFAKLGRHTDLDLVYVGEIPEQVKSINAHLFSRIKHFPSLTRKALLDLFAEAHILFHPSKSEGLGLVLLEAGAAGMAIVVARGKLMAHVDEICADGALFVDRDLTRAEEEEDQFAAHLETLIANRELATRLGERNYRKSRDGALSLVKRNQLLAEVYEAAFNTATFRKRNLDGDPPASRIMRIPSPQLRDIHGRFVQAANVRSEYIIFSKDAEAS